jgi:hypothetical protein
MSLAKVDPDGLRDREWEKTALRECPPVPYVPEKDQVQETVSALKGQHLKTSIREDTTLHLSVWHNGTKEAMIMHVGLTMDTIKKCGHFQAYKEAQALYIAKKEVAKQAKDDLSLFDSVSKGSGKSKKSSKKAKEANAAAKASDPEMQATFLRDIKKAKDATENAKGMMTAAASKMFGFYANLLLVEAKYAWNKILEVQMEGNSYVDLQGVLHKGPRGVSHQSFEDCVMFRLLTLFPINAAEQEKYYLTNVLMKPQYVSVHQFVCHIEQLNAYIMQMPCFYNSPSANATTKPENVLFMEAELGSHMLPMCPIQWHDQYNLHKKGMMPLDMRLVLTSPEAIERVCTKE